MVPELLYKVAEVEEDKEEVVAERGRVVFLLYYSSRTF
jgi:hypothetical protein